MRRWIVAVVLVTAMLGVLLGASCKSSSKSGISNATNTPVATKTAGATNTPAATATLAPTSTPLPPVPTATSVPPQQQAPQQAQPTEPPAQVQPSPVPQGAPSGATALCNDGTYSYSQHRSGTCSHHGGVAQWINKPPS